MGLNRISQSRYYQQAAALCCAPTANESGEVPPVYRRDFQFAPFLNIVCNRFVTFVTFSKHRILYLFPPFLSMILPGIEKIIFTAINDRLTHERPSPLGRGDRLRWERFIYLFRHGCAVPPSPKGKALLP